MSSTTKRSPARPSTTRDLILDALETLLMEGGSAAATLEAVAARAGVSKGGLLYHFGSKEALYEGFLARLRTSAAEDAERTRNAPQGPIAGYLDVSTVPDDPGTRSVLAALRLLGVQEVDVETALADTFEYWYAVIAQEITDPTLARLVQLVGDGLYLHALIGSVRPEADQQVIARIIELVAEARAEASG